MKNEDLISVEQLCTHYNIEGSFITALTEFGLVEVIDLGATPYVHREHLRDLEKFIHLHYELDINMEGMDVIRHLLQKTLDMQNEITQLRNRLKFYEPE